jgi:phosphonate transport system permease protein
MMTHLARKKWIRYGSIVIAVALVLYSIIGIDFSQMAPISFSQVAAVFSGLFQPDWGYVYDGSGEDLVSLLLITICIAFLGTAIATVIAWPFAFFCARNLWKSNTIVSRVFKFICNVLRAFPELVYAIIFVKMVGPGPFAGVLAIGLHQVGMLGKLYTEEIESADEAPVESLEAVGANFWQTLFYARMPGLTPTFISFSLNHFEIAVRSAATLGLVGAGGIGAPIIFAMQSRSWDKVGIILLGIIITVLVIDYLTGWLRKKLQ